MKKSPIFNLAFLFVLIALVLWMNWPEANRTITGQHSTDFVLAVSWQPAFCEKRPNTRECRSQRKGRFDTQNFSLHGLWPQPHGNVYCGVAEGLIQNDKSGRWLKLPKLDLSDSLRNELKEKMPGYHSGLHRHEWYKHGSCMTGTSPEQYYRLSLNLLDQLNNASFVKYIRNSRGERLHYRDIENAFVRSFGKASESKMVVDCYRDNARRIIQELKLSLSGDLGESVKLSELLSAGKKVGKSCPSGIIDPVGLQ